MTRLTTSAALAGLLVLSGALALSLAGCCEACTSVPERFSALFLCPRDRIVVRERRDLPYHLFVCDGPAGTSCGVPSLSVDVAGDPERLALWRKAAREKLDEVDAQIRGAYEVSGCGQHELYGCSRRSVKGGYFFDCSPRGLRLLRHGDGEPAPDSWPFVPKP